MQPRKFQKRSVSEFDAWSFCKEGGRLSSSNRVLEFPRLQGGGLSLLSCNVGQWNVSGKVNKRSECMLSLSGRFSASFSCVVCNKEVLQHFEFSRKLILKTSEAEADSCTDYDAHDDVDVITCVGAVNLRDWIEDEILLVCPMFPRHETCDDVELRQALEEMNATLQDDSAEDMEQEVQRPFANLADLLKDRKH